MQGQSQASQISIGMLVILAGFMLMNLGGVLGAIEMTDSAIIFAGLVIIFACATMTDALGSRTNWTGFARYALVVAWLMYGFAVASAVSILGLLLTLLADALILHRYRSDTSLMDYGRLTAGAGFGLLVVGAVYALLGGQYPIVPRFSFAQFDGVFAIIFFSVTVQSLVMILVAHFLHGIPFEVLQTAFRKFFVPETVIMLVAMATPLAITELPLMVSVLLLSIVVLQTFRQSRIIWSESQLNQRIRELSSMNSISMTITSQLSVSRTVEKIHHEVCSLLQPTLLYIALYDADQEVLNYQVVMIDDEHVDWSHRYHLSALQAHVIQTQEALIGTADSLAMFLDDSDGTDAQYMLVPLVVNSKIIGLIGAHHRTNAHAFSASDFELTQTLSTQAALAIRNATLYDRTVRLADNLSMINQSMQDVLFNADQSGAFRLACDIAMSVTQADRAAIFVLSNQDDYQFQLGDKAGFNGASFVEKIPFEPRVYTNNQRIINDVALVDNPAVARLAKAGDFQAMTEILLRSSNTTIGLLAIYNAQPTYYDPTELNLLQMIADRVTSAMDNADLLQALELYAAEQAQLVHLSRISGGSLDLEQIIYNVCDMLAQMMQVSRVEVGMYLAERDALRIHNPADSNYGIITRDIPMQSIPEFEQLLAQRAPSAVRIYYAGNEGLSDGMRAYMAENGDKTTILVMMQVSQQPLGILSLGHVETREFSDNDHRLLEMANHQISVQIHNARVHMVTEEQLVHRLEQLALIEEIAPQISQVLDLNIILENVLEAALQSTQADFASIALIDRQHGDMFDIMRREVIDNELVPQRSTVYVPEGEGTMWHVIKTRQPIILPDNDAFEKYIPPTGVENTYRSSVMMPLISGDEVVGALDLESQALDFFTNEQVRFVQSLSGHAAISIGNAYLLEQRKQQINVLTSLRELSLDALSEVDADAIVAAVLRTSLVLLHASEAALYRHTDDAHAIELVQAVRAKDGTIDAFEPTVPADILHHAHENGILQVIPDIQQDVHYARLNRRLSTLEHQSALVVPIARRQQIEELLYIGFDEPRQFSHDDLDTVDLLAAQVASHLENAALNTAITQQNDRTRAILDSTRDGIIMLDTETHIQDANSAAVALIGVDLDACIQHPLRVIEQKTDDASQEAWQTLIDMYEEAPDALNGEQFIIPQTDSSMRVLLTLVTPVVDEHDITVGRLLTLRDITKEKELQEFRDTMQSMVLHDLRGPLTAIVTSMYVAEGVISMHKGELDETLLETVNVSLISAEDMLRQVDTLRDLPMMNKLRVTPELTTVHEIAERAYKALQANFTGDNIVIDMAFSEYALAFVDENLIQRVFVNLLHNAFKFTPENGTILIELLDDTEQADFWRVNVADSGPGIPANERDRIFGQFIQVDSKSHRPRAGGKGTGLGLTFCKLAVEGHSGRIWVADESPLGGACFSFTIPKTNTAFPQKADKE